MPTVGRLPPWPARDGDPAQRAGWGRMGARRAAGRCAPRARAATSGIRALARPVAALSARSGGGGWARGVGHHRRDHHCRPAPRGLSAGCPARHHRPQEPAAVVAPPTRHRSGEPRCAESGPLRRPRVARDRGPRGAHRRDRGYALRRDRRLRGRGGRRHHDACDRRVSLDPRVLLLLTVAALWGRLSIGGLVLVLGFTGWFGVSRIVRGEVLALRDREWAIAARALGAGATRTLLRHILPNVASPIIVAIALGIGNVILLEAGLSFFGVGVQPPQASWGTIM